MKNCFIFGALPVEALPIKPDKDDLVLAADRGILNCEKFGITPSAVIGDFDSLGFTPQGENITVLPVRKDDTDIGHCIKHALNSHYKSFYIYGAVGGKLDHTLANIQLAAFIAEQGGKSVFFGDNCRFTAINNGALRFPESSGRVSVFCGSGKAEGVTLKGLSYPLVSAHLNSGYPLGVSNEFTGSEAEIEVKNGTLTVIWYSDVLPK